MALDTFVKGLMDQMAANPMPKLWEVPPPQGREMYRMMASALEPPAVAIGKIENTTMPGPAGPLKLRIYTPVAEGGAALPALVYFHGGGWVIGDLDTHDALCRTLANEAGARVIAVDYRLAPEHKFPGAADDCYAAVKWVEENASELGVDANRIAVAGDSAGGNLAAALCLVQREAGRPMPAFQMLIYPATDMRAVAPSHTTNGQGYMLTNDSIHWYRGNYIADQADWSDWRASPLLASSHAGLPPALVLTAGFDPLRDEGLQYANALSAAGVPTQYVCFERQIHGFITMGRVIEEAHTAVGLCGTALRRAWGG